ncbi:hypothetical protein PG1C_09240 [Rugosibacter aromaticivorans]|uniref:Uncharacterized protein n=1 Tax=Rugosibacter aromaticivorans TaxID=1565605 RepID=A0A0C5J0K3_9PROT|nr:hypothetical protein PG1C_09240 [Rugosibacter aromaticivorans]
MTGIRLQWTRKATDKHLAASATRGQQARLTGESKARSAQSPLCAGRSGAACSAGLSEQRGAKQRAAGWA